MRTFTYPDIIYSQQGVCMTLSTCLQDREQYYIAVDVKIVVY